MPSWLWLLVGAEKVLKAPRQGRGAGFVLPTVPFIFIVTVKAYWVDKQLRPDNLRLALLLLKEGKADMMDSLIRSLEIHDEVRILEQIQVVEQRMPLPRVNLIHAETWLWGECKDFIKTQTEEENSNILVSIYERVSS
eukprot:s1822_g2.t1